MKTSSGILLAALLLAACNPGGNGNKPKLMEPQRTAMDQAKGVESTVQQSAQQQQQEADKQSQ